MEENVFMIGWRTCGKDARVGWLYEDTYTRTQRDIMIQFSDSQQEVMASINISVTRPTDQKPTLLFCELSCRTSISQNHLQIQCVGTFLALLILLLIWGARNG